MENTTIAITQELKKQLNTFGSKGESYAEILARLIKSARERQLHDLLMDEEDTITIDEALADAKKRWQE
jgi:predicted CopG family antitoxin